MFSYRDLIVIYFSVLELETDRIKTRKSRLHSERVRRAFQEALARNSSDWTKYTIDDTDSDNIVQVGRYCNILVHDI